MADIKYNAARKATKLSGVKLSADKEKNQTIEQKLAGIMGTTKGQVSSLATSLKKAREEEEARKKAEEEEQKRAAELAAALSAQAKAAQAAQRKAEIYAELDKKYKKQAQAITRPETGNRYTAVELGEQEARNGVALSQYTLDEARKDYEAAQRAAVANQAVQAAYSGNTYIKGTNYKQLEDMQASAEKKLNVASDAANRNRTYIEKQEQKINSLENQIRAMQPRLSAQDDTAESEYNELVRKYKTELGLYNQAVKLSGTRQTQFSESLAEYKTIENTRKRNEERYSAETGERIQAEINQLAGQISILQQQANGYRRAGNPVQAAQIEEEVKEMRKTLSSMREEHETWKGGAFGYDMEKTLYNLPAEDLQLVDEILADTRDAATAAYEYGMRDVFGDSVTARNALLKKYSPEELEKIEEYRKRELRAQEAQKREDDLKEIIGDSPLAAAALSVGSVLSNFVSAPMALADVTVQALTNPQMPPDFNRRAMAAQNFTTNVRTGVTEQLGSETAQMLYSTLMSGLDSLTAATMPGTLGGSLLGMTAASGTMQDIAERGGTLEQAVLGGVAAGIFEGFFESFSIGNLKAFEETAAASLRDIAKNILKSTVVNASEEAATELANICFDILAMGGVSNYETGIRELMDKNPGMTESQAKKAMAQTLAGQIWDSAVSGGLMGLVFGAGGSALSYTNDAAGIRYMQAYLGALQLPEEYRPQFTYRDGITTVKEVNAYGRAVYDAFENYSKDLAQQRKENPQQAQEAERKAQELGAVDVRTVARAEDIAESMEAGREAARAEMEETGAVSEESEETPADVAVADTEEQRQAGEYTETEKENIPENGLQRQQTQDNAQTVQENQNVNTALRDSDDIDAFAREEAENIFSSLSIYEGQMLFEAVGDEQNKLRLEGRAEVAAALGQIYNERISGGELREGGNTDGDSTGQGRERDVSEDSGGETGAVAEGAGTDQGGNVQAGSEETGRNESQDSKAGRTVTLRDLGVRGADGNQTYREITETSRDPEIGEIRNMARLAGFEVHILDRQIRIKGNLLANGMYENGVIIVSEGDASFSVRQIFEHELFHALKKRTPGIFERATQLLLDTYTDAEFNELVAGYMQLYEGLGLDEAGIYEEICADMYAGMSRKQYSEAHKANLAQLTQQTRALVREQTGVDIEQNTRSANGTRAGPAQTKTAAGDTDGGKYSASQEEKYSYQTLVQKPDMHLTSVNDTDQALQNLTRKEVVNQAIENAKEFGYINENGNVVIHLEDTDTNVILSKNGLMHGLDRRFSAHAPVVLKAGEILKNAIRINELNPRTENIESTYILIGAAKNQKNEPYIVRFIVNRHTNEITTVDVLYAINVKKDQLGVYPLAFSLAAYDTITDPVITIKDLLTFVNLYSPDILPEDVLKYYGHSQRPNGNLGQSALYSLPEETAEEVRDQIEKVEAEISEREALAGAEADEGSARAIYELRVERAALYGKLDELLHQEARAAAREQDQKRAETLEKLQNIQSFVKELNRGISAERTAYKADGDAVHLAKAEDLRARAAEKRREAAALRKEAELTEAKSYRPIESMRKTSGRLLDLFSIQASRRAEMRAGINTVLNRTLTQGYVNETDLESLLRTMYDAGVEVIQPDAAYEEIAKRLRGKTMYVSEEVRQEFGDEWEAMRRELYRVGIKTSKAATESTTPIDSLYIELAEDYPGLFDSEQTDMRTMLEDMQEAAKLGKPEHISLAEGAVMRGLSSEEDFAALYNEVRAELRAFADAAGIESQMRERLLKDTEEKNAQRIEAERTRADERMKALRQHYKEVAQRAAQRRARSEQMTKIRNAIKRLNRAAERNDQTLTKVIAQQTPEIQTLAKRAMEELDTVANSLTDKKRISLETLKEAYEEAKANDPNFIPNPATEKALARVGSVHLNDMTVEKLQALYDAVARIEHDFETANRIIGEGIDQQLDNAGRELQEEIRQAKGTKTESKLAYWLNEESLSPSRALLRFAGYDRSGTMGKLVESFEKGDIDAMGYTLGADMIFQDFMQRKDVQKWLKTAAGENAEMVEIEVPKILEWGEGDKPLYDEKDGHIIKEKVYATKMMLVNMARDLKNDQNLFHIKYGGYSFPDAELYKKGETQAAYARGNAKAIRMTPEFVQQTVDKYLDGIGREYVALLDQYYDVFSKEAVNRVSRQLDGADKAIASSYNPIRTDAAYRGKAYNVFDGTLEGMGSLKSRQQYAQNPMILDDADATMRWHRDNMARYVGYAIPMRNFTALMNYKPAFQAKTTRAEIESKFGTNAGRFLDDFAKVIEEGQLRQGEGFDWMDKLTGKYVSRVLGFNLSSMLKQVSALGLAATDQGFAPILYAVGSGKKTDMNLIRKYTPYLDYRGEGYTYTELANYVRNSEGAQQSKLAQTLLGKNWLSAMDIFINRRLWIAAEYVVQRDTALRPSNNQAEIDAGRDAYYKAVAEVFNRMTFNTQTNYNTMSRPMALRNNNVIVRMATMFKTDAYQMQGIVREQFGAWKSAKRKFEAKEIGEQQYKKAKRRMVYSFAGMATSSVMTGILEMFAKLIRGDDDDYRDEKGKLTIGAAGAEVGKDILYNMVGCVLFGDQIADIISAAITDETLWEPDIPSVSSFYDMANSAMDFGSKIGELIGTAAALRGQGKDAANYWKNNADTLLGMVRKLLYQVGTFTGVPIQNMEKTALGLIGHAFPQAEIQYADLFGDTKKADLANLDGKELEAAVHAYLVDTIGSLGKQTEAEILRLYKENGNKALPGASTPTSITGTDEEGNETQRKPTLQEVGNWDAEYRRKMMDSLGELIGSDFYNSLSDEEKLKLISRANEYARNTAKEYAGMPVNYEKWMENVSSAIDAGTDLASALYFYTKASTLTADKDENGEAISGSLALKELALLESMDTSGAAKLDLLEGVLSPAQLENLDMLLDAGYDVDGAVNMIRTSLETGKSIDTFAGYLADGLDREAAQELYEAMAALEPEEGKRQVSNAQEYEAILASGLDDAEKWTAFAGMFDADEEKALAKMEAVRAAGGTPADYAELRQIGQVDAYLRGVENGLSANTSLRIVNAVAALPELPEGESYDTSERQLAAVQACGTPEEQIIAYAMYGTSTSAKTNTAKFTAALAYDVTPEMYLEARALAKASYDADANGSLKQEEVVAALEAMDLTDRQRAALFQLFDSGWKKNPYGNTADIRDAYAAAKEDK